MKEILKSYKYRIEPSEEHKILLNKHFGSARYVYNHFLNERKTQYLETKKSDNYVAQANKLTKLKKEENMIWLKEINSQTLQQTLKNLETAYLNFYRGNAEFPNFKSKRSKNSFRVPQHITVKDNKIFVPKFNDGIKLIKHREFKGEIRQCTFSKDSRGNYFVSILVCTTHEQLQPTGKSVGIDLGIKNFVVTSDGKKFKNPRYIKQYEKKLKVAQQHLSRKTKGSHQSEKQRLKVASIHEKIANSRKDNLHKISTNLIKSYDVICLEDLNVKGMAKNHKLAKHISDCGWGMFVSMLEYKANWNDKQIVRINRFFPSSKMCSECGWIKSDLKLSDREWVCDSCGSTHDRDVNASKNILSEGISLLSSGTGEYTDGDGVSHSNMQLSVKSEIFESLTHG
jgi:putative transposase